MLLRRGAFKSDDRLAWNKNKVEMDDPHKNELAALESPEGFILAEHSKHSLYSLKYQLKGLSANNTLDRAF